MDDWDTYNVFRRKREPNLCCAVPQRRPVPEFIQGETWDFALTIADPVTVPLGFQPEAAAEAMRQIGYYLFQAFPRRACEA
ncbi:hypothetical protein F6X53_28000 [Methylobacterium soli]|uniref:Uncharacterized protein n=1 Tax=Methylobacterium soli TaxID=553447 RepID=A0A6L3SQ00_9HYPH|nr:hypothetical protein F6X53_28000 [Methylobacterium soli]